ncbi:hypothetical protein niasHT_016662 [Heterodera trifolii]|uniref:Uncharacterized protein n=1 Tax=Heterodera trifolii TaxID=157864 RepID=A0ABD2KVA0_9BILA
MNGDDPTERSQWTEEPSGEVTLGKVNGEGPLAEAISKKQKMDKEKLCVVCGQPMLPTVIFRCRQMNELRMPRGIPSIPRSFPFIVWGNTANDDGRTERTLCLL